MDKTTIDLSFLEGDATEAQSAVSQLIDDARKKVEKMKELELKALVAAEEAKRTMQEFIDYKAAAVIPAFTNAGLTYLTDSKGNTLALEKKYYCNPNKNDADRAVIAEWLKAHGGEHLLKKSGTVAGDMLSLLNQTCIPYAEKLDLNTTSLKAFLKDLLAVNGGVAKISQSDIPDCVHFVTDFDIVVK